MSKIPVMEVALPGFSLDTCTDDQKVFSSKLNTSKVAQREYQGQVRIHIILVIHQHLW